MLIVKLRKPLSDRGQIVRAITLRSPSPIDAQAILAVAGEDATDRGAVFEKALVHLTGLPVHLLAQLDDHDLATVTDALGEILRKLHATSLAHRIH